MTLAQYYAYLNTTYPNDAIKRGELAGMAYRFGLYQTEGFPATTARNQAQFGKRAERAGAMNESSNIGGLT